MKLNPKKNNSAFLIFIISIWVTGCSTVNQISLFNLSYLYQPESAFTQVEACIYHNQDTLSTLYVNVHLTDLSYVKPPTGGSLQAQFRVRYRLMNNYESRQILDSASAIYKDSLNYRRNVQMLYSFTIPARYPENYVAEIEVTDINRNQSVKSFLPVVKTSHYVAQNFSVIDKDGRPLFRDYLKRDEEVRIVTYDKQYDSLTVRCYFREFPVARPPFTQEKEESFKYEADSVFVIPLFSGATEPFSLERKGFYFFPGRKGCARGDHSLQV